MLRVLFLASDSAYGCLRLNLRKTECSVRKVDESNYKSLKRTSYMSDELIGSDATHEVVPFSKGSCP
jgi:hypothetical protein